jgi:DNA-directed RNA polymerase subunit M/transcription elongation factor TFIIS
MAYLNQTISEHIENRIHKLSISQMHKYLLDFKVKNILSCDSPRKKLLLNYFKLLYLPPALLQDVVHRVKFISIDDVISNDEYMFDDQTLIDSIFKYKNRSDDHIQNYSELYTCKKCTKNKTRVAEKQSKSFDEPTTIFVTCINCNNRWKSGY